MKIDEGKVKERFIDLLKNNHTNTFDYYEDGKKYSKSFSDMYQDVAKVCDFLKQQHVEKDDKIGILGENSYEWVLIDLSCFILGCISVGYHTSCFENEVIEAFTKYNNKIMFCDQKFFEQYRNLSCGQYKVISYKTISDLLTESQVVPEVEMVENNLFTISFTSGTSGLPKPIMMERNIIDDFVEKISKNFEFNVHDKIIVFLPLSVILQRLYIYCAVYQKLNIVMCPVENLIGVLQKDKPTIMVGIPFLFEKVYSIFMSEINKSIIKKAAYFIATKLKVKKFQKIFSDKLKAFFGGKMKILVTGGAKTTEKVIQFFCDMGLNLYEVYGITEVGPVSINSAQNLKVGSVGKVLYGNEVKFDDEKQIYVRNHKPWAMRYYDDSESIIVGKDGYVATGDVGYLDDEGFLYVKGRIKEMIALTNGKKVHGNLIEQNLTDLEEIKQASVYGDAREYLVAVIVKSRIDITDEIIKKKIDELNKKAPAFARVKKFVVAKEEFTVENGQLNSSMKLNRKVIYELYKSSIERLYE